MCKCMWLYFCISRKHVVGRGKALQANNPASEGELFLPKKTAGKNSSSALASLHSSEPVNESDSGVDSGPPLNRRLNEIVSHSIITFMRKSKVVVSPQIH